MSGILFFIFASCHQLNQNVKRDIEIDTKKDELERNCLMDCLLSDYIWNSYPAMLQVGSFHMEVQ